MIAATRSPARPATRQADWARRYAAGLAVTDFLVVLWAVIGAQLLRFGVTQSELVQVSSRFGINADYTLISVCLIVGWSIMLVIFRSREARIVGVGFEEYRQVAVATFWTFGIAAIVFYLTKTSIARSYILLALPLGLALLLVSRWLWRQWLSARRRQGEDSYRVLLVGSADSVEQIADDLVRWPAAGYHLVGAVVPDARTRSLTVGDREIPVTTSLDNTIPVLRELAADTLVITSSDHLPPQRIRELSWGLEAGREHLVMVPSLTDVGGPRIHTRPVAGLPLLHVETPQFAGAQLFVKRLVDLVGAGVLIVLLSPVLVAVAIAVKATSPGPVLFKQERIGLQGRTFRMLKFRSMVVDAEALLAGLLARQRDAGNSVLFKMQDDPRITSVGRVLRRYSLDELPQLFNVLLGSMSLVGPRPPLPREVAEYESHVNRKFLVKPGITGLWQVSGRSSLSWEESVRLDLYYVENWSLMGDLVILWRTAKAVVGRDGAY